MNRPSDVQEESRRIFHYDQKAPLEVRVRGTSSQDDSRVQDIEYRGESRMVRARRVDPLFTLPTGRVVFLHSAQGDVESFMPEARNLASRGVASLLIEAPWANKSSLDGVSDRSSDDAFAYFVQAAIEVRKGADVLQTGCPPGGIAFVGHGIGAMIGGILSAVDPRFRALILIAGPGRFSDLLGPCISAPDASWTARFLSHAEGRDANQLVRTSKFASFLFQLGLEDDLFSRSKYIELFDSAGGTKDLTWYEADHMGLIDAGRAERVEWLDVRIRSML